MFTVATILRHTGWGKRRMPVAAISYSIVALAFLLAFGKLAIVFYTLVVFPVFEFCLTLVASHGCVEARCPSVPIQTLTSDPSLSLRWLAQLFLSGGVIRTLLCTDADLPQRHPHLSRAGVRWTRCLHLDKLH